MRQGIDKITSPRASHALLKGLVTEREAFILGGTWFAIVVAGRIVLVVVRGPTMLIFGIRGWSGATRTPALRSSTSSMRSASPSCFSSWGLSRCWEATMP